MAAGPPSPELSVLHSWIESSDGRWSRATLSPVCAALSQGTLPRDHLLRWLQETAIVARSVANGSACLKEILTGRGLTFTVSQHAEENATYLREYAQNYHLDLENQDQLSPEARRLISVIDDATTQSATDSTALCCGMTAIVVYMLLLFMTFSIATPGSADSRETRSTHRLREFLSRDQCLIHIQDAQDTLERMMGDPELMINVSAVRLTFENVLNRQLEVLDAFPRIEDDEERGISCARCGRQGHTAADCRFQTRG